MTGDVTGASSAQDDGSAVEQAADHAREQAGQVGERIQQTAREQIDQRSTQAGEKVSSLASDLRNVGDRLRIDGNEGGARIADQVAERAERAGSYLNDADGTRILSDVEDLGRRQPWLVLAGGIGVGLVAARFLKASSARRYHSRGASSSVTPSRVERDRYPSAESGFESSGYGRSTQALDPAPTPAAFGRDA
jgi:hypothetical protein